MTKGKNGNKTPDKVYVKNDIGTLGYWVKIPLDRPPYTIEITLSEFKYIHDCYEKFSKQCGFRGFGK